SALTSLPVANIGYLTATNQATVLDPMLTSISNVNITLDGTGTIATDQWASLVGDSLTVTGGTYTFPGITNFNSSSAFAQAGGSLTLPNVTTYAQPVGGDRYFQVSGTNASVSLPALASFGQLQSWLYVKALQGGHTSLAALESLAANSLYLQII